MSIPNTFPVRLFAISLNVFCGNLTTVLDINITNVNGSGISLGHPVGATGAILFTKMIYELKRRGGKYGLITLCIGGGQGIATIIENVE